MPIIEVFFEKRVLNMIKKRENIKNDIFVSKLAPSNYIFIYPCVDYNFIINFCPGD